MHRFSRIANKALLPLAVTVLSWVWSTSPLCAEQPALRLPKIFGDSMVLQRAVAIPVWGWDVPEQQVTVTFREQTKRTVTRADGTWMVKLSPEQVGSATTLTVMGSNVITFDNVQVGEVWLCSGQSNMAMVLRSSDSWDSKADQPLLVEQIDQPDLRLFDVAKRASSEPLTDVNTVRGWQASHASSAKSFSAVCYLYGKRIQETLGVPVGLINSSYGNTPIEAWVSRPALDSDPAVKKRCESAALQEAEFDQQKPTRCFNSMIQGLIPFAMRGVAWYQGERNGSKPWLYEKELAMLIADWRTRWNMGPISFGIVQLPDFGSAPTNADTKGAPAFDRWAWIRDAQLRTSRSIAHTGLAVTIDTHDPQQLHPRNKRVPSERLARWALQRVYERTSVIHTGPVYDSYVIDGGSVHVTFRQIGDGLKLAPGKSFKIAGADQVFHWADATVSGGTIRVFAPQVKAPVAVRFAWGGDPPAALVNSEGLPAAPFRTDYWPSLDSPPDSERPHTPENLRADEVHAKRAVVRWDTSIDDVGIASYEVWVNSTLRFQSPSPFAVIQGLAPETSYAVTVRATDGAGHLSPFSKIIRITTSRDCHTHLHACSGQCVDLDSSESHCGNCSSPCQIDQECVAGTCRPVLDRLTDAGLADAGVAGRSDATDGSADPGLSGVRPPDNGYGDHFTDDGPRLAGGCALGTRGASPISVLFLFLSIVSLIAARRCAATRNRSQQRKKA